MKQLLVIGNNQRDPFFNHGIHPIQLFGCNNVRRHYVDHVAQRTQQHSAFQEKTVQTRLELREVSWAIGFQLDHSHGPNLAHVGDTGAVFESRQMRGMACRNGANSGENIFALKNLQVGGGGGASERITRVRMAMKETSSFADELALDSAGANGCTHGENASSDSFGKTHEIGNHACQFAGKHRAAASEAGQDLICDQQDIVFQCDLANASQELHRMNYHAARALQE